MSKDREANRLSGRLSRYSRVGTRLGGLAAGALSRRLFQNGDDPSVSEAQALAGVLGNLKGPLMKVAQILATIPDAVPEDYAQELAQLQNQAPPMSWAFVRRRMARELGPDWRSRFKEFSHTPAAAASLGQVHRAVDASGRELACKLQYPDMASAVEADLKQLDLALSLHRRLDKAIDTGQIRDELADRLREELDYALEACHMQLYQAIFSPDNAALYRLEKGWLVTIPHVYPELSTGRLLSMQWVEGTKLLEHKQDPQEVRNCLAEALFEAWWHPFTHYGVIHGDPHLGNYLAKRNDKGDIDGIHLLDFGCIRKFSPPFVQGVIDLYHGLKNNDDDLIAHAYESWGFAKLNKPIIEALNIWARFIYGPLLDDKVRSIAGDGQTSPAHFGRQQAFQVRKELQKLGPVTIPREFVFMDRAAIGLGGVFLHLKAELNFYQLFHREIEDFDKEKLAQRQKDYF
jgi:predicted unusual protein kinase regulating ubiquinone biosynthesis (AarF/ABC1/UbiB family)